ncbi:hypothetical protein RRG08_051270 [Elysia crispata]|uniref:Uncharacterized protein n=1 Tax=Elysia crispata TaxID=231223 RepID=A0AAE0YB28_9GAST|nr:hypothetical protein RRG08_051270 [Elysia crispata]
MSSSRGAPLCTATSSTFPPPGSNQLNAPQESLKAVFVITYSGYNRALTPAFSLTFTLDGASTVFPPSVDQTQTVQPLAPLIT